MGKHLKISDKKILPLYHLDFLLKFRKDVISKFPKASFLVLVLLCGQYGFATSLLVPSATISGSTTVCQNAASPLITFTGSGGTAPYTFIYTVSGTPGNQTISTTAPSSTVTFPAPTNATGIFTYSLVSVQDSSPPPNPINVTGTAIITVNAAPTVDFTIVYNNSCSGTIVQFNSSVIGSGSYTYSWDFGDGSALSTAVNPTHAFTSLGCGTASFNVTLTITGGGCTVTRSYQVNVNQKPDISFIDPNATSAASQFNNCTVASITSTTYSITVENTSASSSCITSYSVNWGDTTPQENNISFPISHTYTQLGVYNMTITAIGNFGCSNSITYTVKNISNPSAGVLNPGGTVDMCIPTPIIQYTIGNWAQNSPGTTYAVNYGDGSPTLNLDQATMVASPYYNAANPLLSANYPIPYSYTTNSCPGGDFIITLVVTNACRSTTGTVVGGNTRSKPIANFTAPLIGCVTSNILFTNTTTLGYDSGCVSSTRFTWNFGDPASGASNVITTGWVTSATNGNHIFSGTGTYTVTLTAQNGCGTTTKTQQICIESPLIPLFTINPNSGCTPLIITPDNTTIITNSCPGNPTYQWNVTYASGFCGSVPATWNYASGTTSTTAEPTFNFVTPGTYTISMTINNSCGSVTSGTQTVTVKKPPTVILAVINTACGSASITPSATVTNCAPIGGTLTYAWSLPGGSPSTSTAVTPGTITYPAGGPYTVSLVVTNECGPSNTAAQTFSVNTAPVITNSSLSQTICSGSSTTLVNLTANSSGTTFSWTASATTGISGFTPSGTNTIPVQTITTTNTSPGTVTYTIIPTIGSDPGACAGPSVMYIVNVNPAPTITTQPASSSVCLGGTPTPLTVALNSSSVTPTYQWYSNISNAASGGTLISGATNATYNPPATTAGTLYYYCIISLSSGGCASVTSNVATVIVSPSPTINTQPTPTQDLCIGVTIASPLTVSYSGGTGTATYQWYNNINNTTTGGTPVGTNSPSYTPPVFTTAGTYYHYVTISLSGNNCGAATSNVAQINVFNDPTITTQPTTTQTLCQGATPTTLQVVATGGNGAFSYQWYSNNTNNTTSGTAISGANSSTYLPPTTTVGINFYYCIISQTATLGCSVTSTTAEVIINASPTIVNQPVSSTVCLGGTPTVLSLTYSNGAGTPTYQWYSNTSNNNTTGTAISGETNPTYSPPATTVGTIYYYCTITFSGIVGSCATISTNTADVTITTGSTINQQPQPTQSLCVGITIPNPLTVTYTGGTGTPSYQWYSNTTNSNVGGTSIPGATGVNYSPPVYTSSGNYYYYVVINFSGSGCGAKTSTVAEVIIVNDPIINTQPLATQTVCQNTTATILTVATSGGIGTTYNYQWYSSSTNNITSGTAIPGETNSTFTPLTITAGTVYYYCTITQAAGSGCNATTNTAEVIVNVAPTIANQPASSTVCVNGTPTLLSLTYNNGVGTPTYQWYTNTINSNTGGNIIIGATNATYSPPALTSGTTYYYCVVTFSALTGGCSVITTNPATVIVNDNPVISSTASTICSATTFTVTPANGGGNIVPSGTTYTWSNPIISPTATVTGASAQPTAQPNISQTLVNTTTSPSTVTYTVTPASGTCVGANFTVTVTVNPAINPNIVLNDNRCFGVNIASITTNITGGIPFSSGTPYNISWTGPGVFTSTATSISNLAPGTYNVTIADAGGCPFSNSYTITEPADIIITVDNESDVTCYNAANGSIQITVTGGTGSYVYTWTKGGSPYAVTEDISGLSPGNYTVSVTDANNCGPRAASFTITEPPLLVLSLVSQTNVLCYGASTGAIVVNVTGGTVGSGYGFSWSGPGGFTSASQNLSGIPAGTYNLTVTDANGCIKTLSVVITQSNDIVIAYTTTPITCYGANNASMTVTLSGGNAPYTFQWSNLSTSLIQTNLSAGNYTITVTDNVGCIKTATIVIPEAPVFTVNPTVSNITCFGAHNGSINLNLTGGIAPVALSWSDGSSAGLIRNNLAAGTYTATISDGTPCYIVRTFTIVEPQALVLSANLTNAFNCTTANSGAIDLIVAGGTPPYTYSWSNSSATEDLNNITSGNYLVTVTDANGCIKTAQYSITRPDPILINVITQTTFDCAAHSVNQNFTAQVSGGIPPYQLQWSSGTISGANNETMHSDVNGTVLLTVTDSYGCIATQTVVVDTPELGYPTFDQTSIGYTTYGIYSIGDPIQFTSNITGDYVSVSWDFGDGTFSTEVNPVHTYLIPKDYIVTQTVTYPFGCVYTQTISLIIEKGYVLVVPTAFTPNNDRLNDTYRPVTKGLKNIVLDIYDTWGSLIYSEKGDVLIGWDSKIKGFNAENGNYYSKVTAETFYGTIVNSNQTFVLIK
ncbi:PKD domain-containing protein [Flavobacterium sp.]|uniref:PKD domain-containing protein n=1 Tax=Flavobacterium sp. TaxID=239 RepID=UPI0025CF6133|nr:PKD domain-containing protein [Flavobacterium sp.]